MKYYFTIYCNVREVRDCVVEADGLDEAKKKIESNDFDCIDEHEDKCEYDFTSVDFEAFEEDENAEF